MQNNAAVKTFQELAKLNITSVKTYFAKFVDALSATVVTSSVAAITIDSAVDWIIDMMLELQLTGKKIMVAANGGSAAIAVHSLADYANAGGLNTLDFYGPGLITCMANDYGYENVFARPIELFAKKGDILFAISSSGQSSNIINACKAARDRDCFIITFSGFDPNNLLRKAGNINFYTYSTHYGFVELAHQTLFHCILDLFIRARAHKEMRELLS